MSRTLHLFIFFWGMLATTTTMGIMPPSTPSLRDHLNSLHNSNDDKITTLGENNNINCSYIDPDTGTVQFGQVPYETLNMWLTRLNGRKTTMTTTTTRITGTAATTATATIVMRGSNNTIDVVHKKKGVVALPRGVTPEKVTEELETRRKKGGREVDSTSTTHHSDWRDYENEDGYTHLEELLIYQPEAWKKQAREYLYNYNYDLSRVSTTKKRQTSYGVVLEDGSRHDVVMHMKNPVLVTLFHDEISSSCRYEPLTFLLSYDARGASVNIWDDMSLKQKVDEETKKTIEKEILNILAPLDYFFSFQDNIEAYDLTKLREVAMQSGLYRLCLLKELDCSTIVGQRLAKHMIRSAIVRHVWARSIEDKLRANKKPLSLIFAGPSGNGKTELAVQLADLLNKSKDKAFHKVDCGKVSTPYELFGMSGPMQGAEEGSTLNNFVVRMASNPRSVGIVLLDEIEKAGKDVIHALYQVMDKGEWTNKKLESGHQTKTISCSNLIFIMTTNAADDFIRNLAKSRPFLYTLHSQDLEETGDEIESMLRNELMSSLPFTQAFMGRIGKVVPFLPMANGDTLKDHPLCGEMMTVTKMLIEREQEKSQRTPSLMVKLDIPPRVKHDMAMIILDGCNAECGVRSIQKAVEDRMSGLLMHRMLLRDGKIKPGSEVEFSAKRELSKTEFRLKGLANGPPEGEDSTAEAPEMLSLEMHNTYERRYVTGK